MADQESSGIAAKREWDANAEEDPLEREVAMIENLLKNMPDRFRQGPVSFGGINSISEQENEDECIPALANVIDLTIASSPHRKSSSPMMPESLMEHYSLNGLKIKPGSTVQIRALEHPQLFKAEFIHIRKIIDTPDGIKLSGIPLARLRNLRGRVPRLRNEVAMILHVNSDVDGDSPDAIEAAIEVPVTDILRVRNCHFTNADCPEYPAVVGFYEAVEDLEQNGVLMCRWRHVFKYRDSATRIACIKQAQKNPGQRYTLGDMFSGAGGASYGARKAGFQVKVACDHHPGACKTYAEVFPEADLYMLDIFDFITKVDMKIRVDVLHLSPPCQFWSPAHTCAGVNDEANIAVLFSCHELIKKLRPRIFTLEQTFGILHPRFEFYFNALVHGFTQYNYSVRWKVVDLTDWGSPATRKRLVMIGSCPGEELPPFPAATHVPPGVKKRGKKPHVTVKRMLDRIPPDAALYDDMHQPYEMVRKRLPRWDPDVTLKRCITTNGGYGNYHPNGRRDFTLREYATLQTFPVDYPFQNPDRKKQIGNAFPPMVVKMFYTHLRKWLERQDRVYAIENEPIDPDDPDIEILNLDDDGLRDDQTTDGEDVEYMGSRRCSSASGSSGYNDRDGMDLDGSDCDYGPVPCIDVNQRPRVWPAIDLTLGRESNPQDYIDLTGDDD
ncbi:hypothetical protein ONZ43_g4374 [Nemania bipapillata]|uniref:Uncharacterized protein n=1 Tax=Nemania bipapillata TaxID=110536 RepID=A0ACC2INH1_9PEZI|nr:hypothetical protein ONZ43_g4374 [Nemania bipapillata]